ncbi:MAG TPA: FtsQ-type POTRA domain-containing protein [Hellea balneolensis]|uniref:Cell division protein FtsQ n=1 Tax=Hellea balneolensis TaxID=287478 RepID=A0A7C5QV00_9PROT|nr:FtsQ-type POTRA domain-containing protein [Hellea balneolensis]
MATLGGIKGKRIKAKSGPRRVSPLKPGLRGIRNWTTAQLRSASYSKAKRIRLIWSGIFLVLGVIWGGLWLGGFIPDIQAAGERAVKNRLVAMGFVVERVDVVGEGRISESQVRAVLGVKPGDYLFDMDISTAQKRVQSLSWVDTAVVRRLWPNRVVVHINERVPFAMWQKDKKLYVIDRSGVVIHDANIAEFADLPLVVGAGANENAAGFLQMVQKHPNLYQKLAWGAYIGDRRWDIVIGDTHQRIKLPEFKPEAALGRLQSYQRTYGLLDYDIQSIDLRIKNRIFIMPGASLKNKSRNRKA